MSNLNDDDVDKDRPNTTERSGQGQSGYGAGRHAEDPAQRYQNRNPPDDPETPADAEDSGPDERPGLGLDDRFTRRRR